MTYWNQELLQNNYEEAHGIWIPKGSSTEETVVDTKGKYWEGYDFNKRAEKQYTTSCFEKIASVKIVRDILESIPSKENILEVGAGDGRFVDVLFQQKDSRIGFNEFNPRNLHWLKERAPRKHQVVYVAGDLFQLPLRECQIDVLIAWGVLSQTPHNFLHCLEWVQKVLSGRGVCIIAEPLLESHLVYSLVRNDLEEFLEASHTATRASDMLNKRKRYRLHTLDFYNQVIQDAGFQVLQKGGLSIFPSLVFGGVCQDQNVSEETKNQLERECLEKMLTTSEGFMRQAYWVLHKKN